MEYIEVICPHCKKVVEFKTNETTLDCPFCDGNVVRTKLSRKIIRQDARTNHGANEMLTDAYEEGVKKGREVERKRATDEAKTYLWASIVLGAIGGGVIGGKMEGSPGQQAMRITVGILLGGFIGGMRHIFGCFLTLVIFIVVTVAIIACVAL